MLLFDVDSIPKKKEKLPKYRYGKILQNIIVEATENISFPAEVKNKYVSAIEQEFERLANLDTSPADIKHEMNKFCLKLLVALSNRILDLKIKSLNPDKTDELI